MNLCLDLSLSCLGSWHRLGCVVAVNRISLRYFRSGVDPIMAPAAELCQASTCHGFQHLTQFLWIDAP